MYLEARSIDDCLELFDLLMVTELVGKADREAKKEKVRQHPRLARASAKLAAAVEILLEATTRGEAVALDDLWELIEAQRAGGSHRRSHRDGPPEDPDNDGEMRAGLASRILVVSGFLKTLTEVIEFGASAEAAPVLAAMERIPQLLRSRRKPTIADIDGAIPGSNCSTARRGPTPRAPCESPRTAMRYVNPGPAAVAEVTELLHPPKRAPDGLSPSQRRRP